MACIVIEKATLLLIVILPWSNIEGEADFLTEINECANRDNGDGTEDDGSTA